MSERRVRFLYFYENVENTGDLREFRSGMITVPKLSLRHDIDESRVTLYAEDDRDAEMRIAEYLEIRTEDAPRYSRKTAVEPLLWGLS